MNKPTKETEFHPISELENYCNPEKYFCCSVVFAPEESTWYFDGCPPFIEIMHIDMHLNDESIYFEIPEIVAYYAKTHPGYTPKGTERKEQRGRENLAAEMRSLLGIKSQLQGGSDE